MSVELSHKQFREIARIVDHAETLPSVTFHLHHSALQALNQLHMSIPDTKGSTGLECPQCGDHFLALAP